MRSRSPARLILAALLLAMAGGQLSDMAGFAAILADYRFAPDLLVEPAAWTLAGAEAVAGVLLLRGRRAGAHVALAVTVVWAMLAVEAFGRGLALDNCGCFGVHLGQRLRWWILLEDAEFIGLALWVGRGLAGQSNRDQDRPGGRPAEARSRA